MKELLDMVTAHLQNVQQEIVKLESQKKIIDDNIVNLQNYISRGTNVLEEYKNKETEKEVKQDLSTNFGMSNKF